MLPMPGFSERVGRRRTADLARPCRPAPALSDSESQKLRPGADLAVDKPHAASCCVVAGGALWSFRSWNRRGDHGARSHC